MAKYNHCFTFAFTGISEHPTADDMKGKHLRAAMLKRLSEMDDDELYESIGEPCDSFEED